MVHDGAYDVYASYVRGDPRSNAFVTINWKPGVKPEVSLRLLQLILNKKWMPEEYYISHEQRGDTIDTIGTGYHIHILIVGINKPRSQIHREIYSTVKNYVGTRHHIDVRMIPNSWLEDKKAYLRGEKWDGDKLEKVKMDKIFRLQHSL